MMDLPPPHDPLPAAAPRESTLHSIVGAETPTQESVSTKLMIERKVLGCYANVNVPFKCLFFPNHTTLREKKMINPIRNTFL